jgi:hypothetical protein
VFAPISCNDNNACTTDSCNAATGCVYTPSGGGVTYFDENFANNNKGWSIVAGQGWAIGPLVPNPYVPGVGIPDPTTDYTPNTNDNGVAGVYIGTQTDTATLHGLYYITSPVINIANAPTAILEFWRHLNTDYPPYMDSTVEVYNGSSWVTIFNITNSTAIFDSAWTKVSYDVTAYKNANFRVRFGWSVGQAGVYDISSWNIDDLKVVSNGNCP